MLRTNFKLVSALMLFLTLICVSAMAADKVAAPKMIELKGGCFQRGDVFGDGESDEKPTREVCVDSFAIGRTEVTKSEFAVFVAATSYVTDAEKSGGCNVWRDTRWRQDAGVSWKSPGFEQVDNHPVTCVSWNDAQAYAAWLSRERGTAYRLPTEAEWEFAARSGGKKVKFAVADGTPAGANLADESMATALKGLPVWKGNDAYPFTAPGASFKANEAGLHDMAGNVWEWVQDYYWDSYFRIAPKKNPAGPAKGKERVLRGGGWSDMPEQARTVNRAKNRPDAAYNFNGFRLATTWQNK